MGKHEQGVTERKLVCHLLPRLLEGQQAGGHERDIASSAGALGPRPQWGCRLNLPHRLVASITILAFCRAR